MALAVHLFGLMMVAAGADGTPWAPRLRGVPTNNTTDLTAPAADSENASLAVELASLGDSFDSGVGRRRGCGSGRYFGHQCDSALTKCCSKGRYTTEDSGARRRGAACGHCGSTQHPSLVAEIDPEWHCQANPTYQRLHVTLHTQGCQAALNGVTRVKLQFNFKYKGVTGCYHYWPVKSIVEVDPPDQYHHAVQACAGAGEMELWHTTVSFLKFQSNKG